MSETREATHRGVMRIGDVQIPCFVLDDGTRVISGRGVTAAIGMRGRGQGVQRIPTHRTLKSLIDQDLTVAIANPIKFIGSTSRKTNPTSGYEATVLLRLCEVILTARDDGLLKTEQEIRYARCCDVLVRAFATVGIIALVDEATGYQAVRDRDDLHRILEAYIAKELLPWTKRFPDEFYKELFRLRSWQYSPVSVKRPRLVGLLTEQIVYKKLPEGVLDELKLKNPKVDENGRRRHKHHQFLTDEVGNPHLEKHLAVVTALMRASPNWSSFRRLLARAVPSPGEQRGLFDDLEDDLDGDSLAEG